MNAKDVKAGMVFSYSVSTNKAKRKFGVVIFTIGNRAVYMGIANSKNQTKTTIDCLNIAVDGVYIGVASPGWIESSYSNRLVGNGSYVIGFIPMRQVIDMQNVILGIINGSIGIANDNCIMYNFEIDGYNKTLYNTDSDESDLITEIESNQDQDNMCTEVSNNDPETCIDETIAEQVKADDNTSDCNEIDPGSMPENTEVTIDMHNESEYQDQSNCINIELADDGDQNASEQYYDLIPTDDTVKRSYPRSKIDYPAKKNKNIIRHMYSESECLEIAFMTIRDIMSKYNVSATSASKMNRNARNIFNEKNNISGNRSSIMQYFDKGLNQDDVIRILNAQNNPSFAHSIHTSYKHYLLKKSISKEGTDGINEYCSKLIEDVDIAAMEEIFKMPAYDLASKFSCSYHTARMCKNSIIDFLMTYNPIYVIGGYSDTVIDNGMNDDTSDAVRYVYYKAMELFDDFRDCYQDKSLIVTGMKSIPDSIKDSDRNAFIAMLRNAINSRSIPVAITEEQKYVCANTSSMAYKMMAFMSIDEKRLAYTSRWKGK